MSQTKTSKKKLNLLQVFRGLAAVLVVLYHGNGIFAININQILLSNSFIFAHTGVDFFFVLSGFIIFYVHQKDIGKKEKFKDFIFKRFLRVYPVYWIVLIPRFFWSGKDINFLTYISSFTLFPYPRPPIVNVSWTLSYEIFFYLIFSLMILTGLKYLKPLIITWLSLIVINRSLSAFNIFFLPKDNLFFDFIFNTHNLEFCLGCLAAYIVTKYRVKQGMSILVLGIVLFSLSSIATVHIVNTIADRTFAPLTVRANSGILAPMEEFALIYYGIPSMLIILGSAALDLSKDIKVPKVFIYLGDASYSIYLIHGSVINILSNWIAQMNLEYLFQSDISKFYILITSIIAGCLLHSYIELPLITIIRKNSFISQSISQK